MQPFNFPLDVSAEIHTAITEKPHQTINATTDAEAIQVAIAGDIGEIAYIKYTKHHQAEIQGFLNPILNGI